MYLPICFASVLLTNSSFTTRGLVHDGFPGRLLEQYNSKDFEGDVLLGTKPLNAVLDRIDSTDSSVFFWDAQTGTRIHKFKAGRSVASVALSQNLRFALVGDGGDDPEGAPVHNRLVWLWDLKTGKLIKKFSGHTTDISVLRFSPNGAQCLSTETKGDIFLHNLNQGFESLPLKGPSNENYRNAEFSPDSNLVLAYGYSVLSCWDARTRKLLFNFDNEAQRPYSQHTCAAFSPTGDNFAVAKYQGTDSVTVRNSRTGKRITTIPDSKFVTDLAYISGGKKLLTCSDNGNLDLWSANSGKNLRHLALSKGTVRRIIVNRTNNRCLISWQSGPPGYGFVSLLDLNSWKLIWKHDDEDLDQVVSFDPSGANFLIFGKKCSVLSSDNGKVIRTFTPK